MAFALSSGIGLAAERTIGVFIALADNKHQGIVPVPEAIGNGDDPERNLYWGTADGLRGFFDRSKEWKLTQNNDSAGSGDILRTRTYRRTKSGTVLSARAYRGASIRKCLADFESAVQRGSYDLVVFIGHNGLMDFDLPKPVRSEKSNRRPDCIVLCCRSESYFKPRLEELGGRPVLLTKQLMYPGAFILAAVVEDWETGANLGRIRERAAAAYASNQKISQKAALGVFSDLGEPRR